MSAVKTSSEMTSIKSSQFTSPFKFPKWSLVSSTEWSPSVWKVAEFINSEIAAELFSPSWDTHSRSPDVTFTTESIANEKSSAPLAELHDTDSVKCWLSPTTAELLSTITLTDNSSWSSEKLTTVQSPTNPFEMSVDWAWEKSPTGKNGPKFKFQIQIQNKFIVKKCTHTLTSHTIYQYNPFLNNWERHLLVYLSPYLLHSQIVYNRTGCIKKETNKTNQ